MTPSSQHRHPNRGYRPDPAEYEPAKTAVEATGWDMNTLIRAFLRSFNRDPQRALAALDGDLKAVRADTPRGRPPAGTE